MPHSDLDDDKIRFIIPHPDYPRNKRPDPDRRKRWRLLVVALIAVVIGVVACICYKVTSTKEEIAVKIKEASANPVNAVPADTVAKIPAKAYTVIKDTTIDSQKLTILTPVGGKPGLSFGEKSLDDTTAILVVQAADIGGDNGKIVGACVSKGNLISTGQSKAGFCAIIGGNITVGVADATPYLEQAIDAEGDFFRQYPLVVGNQIVENKPKGRSCRKALAELGGKIVVVMSHDKMTFHDFSQSLVDLGVTNAIYLVGSTSYGFAKTEDGSTVSFGERVDYIHPNVSYLVWQK